MASKTQPEAAEYGEHGQFDLLWPVIKRLLPPPCDILEVGCGYGLMASRLSWLRHRVIGVDTWTTAIEYAQRNFPDIRFALHSAYDDFAAITDPVDVVLSVEVIEHLMLPGRFLENAYSILKPGGRILLTTPYHGYLKNLALSLFNKWDAHFSVDWADGHVKFFSEASLSKMLRSAGFDSITFNNVGRFPYLWKSMVCSAKR